MIMQNLDDYKYLDLAKAEYLDQYNNNPFKFKHSLCECSLLSINNLSEVILNLPESRVFFSSGDVDVTANLDTAHIEHKPDLSLEDAFNNIEEAGAFVMVRQPESDPVFKELFNDLILDVKRFANSIDPGLHGFMLYLFIASPNSVTPFHIDRYSTLLFQLKGHKDVNVWKPWDRDLITDIDLERFFSYEEGFSPELKDRYIEDAIVNHIKPGEGVHIPFVSPHWINNSDEVSVSLSIIFNSKKTTNLANSLMFNKWYRKTFNRPAKSVNESILRDKAKANIYSKYQDLLGFIGK